jgi:ketosteroid isomerase-like protein
MHDDAAAFSKRWARNWNAHDVDAVLDDFHDDVTFVQPSQAYSATGSADASPGFARVFVAA